MVYCCCSDTKSCMTLCNLMDCSLPVPSVHGIPQAILDFFLQGIFLTQRWNPCLLHWQAGSLSAGPPGKAIIKDRGDRRLGRNSQEQPWGKVLFPHQQHKKIFELFCSYWNPSWWDKLLINDGVLPTAWRPHTSWTWRLLMLTPTYSPPTHQKNVQELIMPCLNNTIKLLAIFPSGTHDFEGISPLCPSSSDQAIKLSFSASPKTLFPRFN